MSLVENLGMRVLRSMDPERAHGLALTSLRYGFGPKTGPFTSPRLKTEIAGLKLPNPIGLAAGFDKNATVLHPLAGCGFGFIEVGAATPRGQEGNPRPRLFRLSEDQAVINRFGFNNDGMEAIGGRLAKRPQNGIIGLNLGANKDSEDRASDFARVLSHCGAYLDFATVNVSSPNTEKLRDLQGKEALSELLSGVMSANSALSNPIPIFLKIAPDLSETEIAEIAEIANSSGIAGLIATNTTLSREGLTSAHKEQAGGLSGQPLFEKSTRVLALLASQTNIPIIGVGGVGSAQQAYQKICAGASAIQLYSALVYGGVSLIDKITKELDTLLESNGFSNIGEAVGTGREKWM